MCSTPFGITGCYARLPMRSSSIFNVLNAFRHHRVLRRRRPSGGRARLNRAQRLSASQGATRITPAAPRSRVCRAQRLSASQGATPRRQGRPPGGRDVLNAFRHHRVLRQGWCDCHPNRYRVLNAFRHHRVLRLRRPQTGEGGEVCSTPFGITGCYASESALSPDRHGVLNAFRHHRVLRCPLPAAGADPLLVLNAFRHHRVLRLPGSREGNGSGVVLNAFRHHRVLRKAQ